ncbi:MAG: hypothetical protein DMF19_07825 [Verrucomicrobia bacterium]|nr:MAG: hypothetical protein DMF19_07825 [Verrucomicrobiota bacterium]
MKKIFLLLSVLILPLISLWAGDEDDVLCAERELALCYQNCDAACIEQRVMKDYTLTNSKGKITARADDVEEARKHDPKDLRESRHEGTGARRSRCRDRNYSRQRNFRCQPFDAEFRFTDTFVKDHGRWRLWAGQAIKITP